MARRIKSTKRKHYGNRTFGGGNTKNRRGKGNRGGVGRAGYHKHNWLRTVKFENNGKPEGGFHNPNPTKMDTISLKSIVMQISRGELKAENGVYKLAYPKSKVISSGKFPFKAEVTALVFSEGAKERIETAGGKAVAQQGLLSPVQPENAAGKSCTADSSQCHCHSP